MNFLLDKDEHREMPPQQLNSQANITQTQAAAVTETQPMWRRRFLRQKSPINSQTGKNIKLKSAVLVAIQIKGQIATVTL